MIESGLVKFWTSFEAWKMILKLLQTFCEKNGNVANSETFGLVLAKYLGNTLRYEAVAENGDKNKFIMKEFRFLQVYRLKFIFPENSC